jgi:hypothetical protein
MKKIFGFLVVLFIGATAMPGCNTRQKKEGGSRSAGQSKDVVKVQGHPHELLTKLHAEGKWQHPQAGLTGTPTDNVNFDDLNFVNIATSMDRDTAVLIVKWTDGKKPGLNILAWGFIFDSGTDTVTSEVMIRAVATADSSLSVLLLNSGISFATGDTLNYAIGGFGYNYADRKPVPLDYDSASVQTDTCIHFTFDSIDVPTPYGQYAVPLTPWADMDSTLEKSKICSIIEHPFNYEHYGYACYDFDWWTLDPDDEDPDNHSWQSGWYTNGYWAFFVRNSLAGKFEYSNWGASQRPLKNRYVDGWVFSSLTTGGDMSGDYVPAEW